MTEQDVRELKKSYGKRLANPAEVLRLINLGRKAVGLKPWQLSEIPKGSNPFRDCWGPLNALERGFPQAALTTLDEEGCHFCHCHRGYEISDACVSGKEAALARAWKTKINNEGRSTAVMLPLALNQFLGEYEAGLWPEFVDYSLVCLSDEGLNERIVEAQGIEWGDLFDLPDAIVACCDTVWMPRDKIGKYLISADDAKYLCGKAA